MVLIEEHCALCGVKHPYYSLYRCHVCRRGHCRNCFLYDVDGKILCLRCAKRRVSPRGPKSKYADLSMYLVRRSRYSKKVTLPFSKIEEIIGDRLPFSAHHYEHWWSNAWNRSPSEAWLTIGWSMQDVDLNKKEVTFVKDEQAEIRAPITKMRRKPVSEAFKALARKRRTKKPSGPSKTRVAKVQARSRNIERQKIAIKEYRGKFQPKKMYEKKLYRAEEKPE